MIKLLILALFAACANSAPQYFEHRHHHWPHHRHHGLSEQHRPSSPFSDEFFGGPVFDTGRFWRELSDELEHLNNVMEQFHRHFSINFATVGYENNEYKITIPLTGFDEKDITVKAKSGVLMIQAVHRSEDGNMEKHYLDVRGLPDDISLSGTYTYDKNTLKISFPVIKKSESPVDSFTELPVVHVTEETSTDESVNRSVEEMVPQNKDENKHDADASVEVSRGDKDREIITNSIPNNDNQVEATTYSVDLKDEVEFVPIRY